jgi:membrane carboxypeptidase/penicillin-binding protein PbpC
MTARGSAWDGRPFDPPTAPLPRVDYVGDDGPGYVPPVGRPPRRRGRRLLRGVVATIVVLVVLAALALGALLAVTPSVSNAQALAQAQDVAHHAVYPGPPVPARFSDSLVATEDHRFYSEPGIDILALARVVEAGVTGQGDQGGATLYQQLAKLLYTNGTSGIRAKVEQVGLAEKLYLTYSHAQILQMYADVAYFGHGYYGLAAASCGYFGTTPAGLSWPEAATLAGLVQGPSTDDPILHYARGRAREQHVLGRLVATNVLTQAQASAAFSQPLDLVGGSATACTANP